MGQVTRLLLGVLGVALLTSSVGWSAPPTALPPLTTAESEAWHAVRADPPPRMLTRNSHYVISDERRHDLYRSAIENAGGVFVGVGTNQNYEMIAWARSEVAVLLDFDQMVVDLHAVYRVIFLNAPMPSRFVRMWHTKEARNTAALITASITDPTKQKGALKAFRYARKLVYGKLRRTIRRDKRKGSTSFLTDPEQYNYLVALFRAGRVFAVRGDLTATRTMRDLANVMKQFNRPLRTLYISNCEQYFSFGDDYRQNIAVQHTDERSLILRTRPWRRRSKKETDQLAPIQYTFMTQDFPTMRAWMNNKKTKKLYDMIHYHKVPNRLVRLTRLPKTTRSK
jgi:hypothetical protein